MNWTAVSEQRQDAVRRVFYMLIFMVLVIIRAGLDARIALATGSPGGMLPNDNQGAQDQLATTLSAFYRAALTLLRAAEAAARLLGMSREVYELMNMAHAMTQSLREQVCVAASLCARPIERLDSS